MSQDIQQQVEDVRERRLRQTAKTTLIAIIFLGFVFLYRAIEWEIYSRVLSISAGMGLGTAALIALRLGYSRAFAAFLGISGCSIAIVYAAYSSGGLANEASLWLFIMPLIGALIGGRPGCLYGIGFSTLSIIVLFTVESLFGAPPDLTPESARVMQSRLHQVGALIVVSISIWALLKQVAFADEQLTNLVLNLSEEVGMRTEAEQQAAHANRIKSEFLANMSHEIRTPMNGVMGVLNILKEQELNEAQHEYVELAHRSSNNLMLIINDILDLSKIESGKLELEVTDFNLTTLLDDISTLHRLSTEEKGLTFDLNFEHTDRWVQGDPVRIRQVIHNLLSNAIKFTEQGQITLNAKLERIDSFGWRFSCSVSDTGIGLPADQRDKLFQPFSQMESSTTRRFGGTGLGLSISKQLVEMMDGEIGVSSAPGEGSTFSFNVVLKEASAPDSVTMAPKLETSSTEQTDHLQEQEPIPVLLVEDNPINVEVAKAMLAKFNLLVTVAQNGKEALSCLRERDFRLVFMDCQMPLMDGYEATREIRKQSRFASLPILAMTANAMKGDKEKCLAAGMSDYIAKPIMPDTLSEKLTHWLH